MATKLYWIDGTSRGRLAISSRPRGGDWLPDEMQNWKSAGVSTVLSLLTSGEERELNLEKESREAQEAGLKFVSLPIPDLQVPSSPSEVAAVLDELDAAISSGKGAVIHCRQGVGRAGMIAASFLVLKGHDPASAVRIVEQARGVNIPETPDQRRWIDLFAASLTHNP
jgi:protein-tyrosine phosphatase